MTDLHLVSIDTALICGCDSLCYVLCSKGACLVLSAASFGCSSACCLTFSAPGRQVPGGRFLVVTAVRPRRPAQFGLQGQPAYDVGSPPALLLLLPMPPSCQHRLVLTSLAGAALKMPSPRPASRRMLRRTREQSSPAPGQPQWPRHAVLRPRLQRHRNCRHHRGRPGRMVNADAEELPPVAIDL